MPAFTLPPDTRSPGSGNPPADMNAVTDALSAMGAQYNALNAAYGTIDPAGVLDSTTGLNNLLAGAGTAGKRATGLLGTYKISAPLVMPPGGMLDGGIIADQSGFTLMPTAGFLGNAAVYMSDAVGS